MTTAAQTQTVSKPQTATTRTHKRSAGQIATGTAKYVILIALAITYAFPLYWMISSALKTDPQVYRIPPVLVPNPAMWNNFIDAWNSDNFTLYTFNSIFRYALPYTVFTVLSSAIVAYGFSRIRWPGRDKLFYLCIGTMLIPYTVIMVPLFIIFKQLHWTGTYLPMVVPALFGNAFFIFMLRQFFMTLPEELSEAARIDGASEWGAFTRIVLPLSAPGLAVTAIFAFQRYWNSFLWPLVVLQSPDKFTLQVGLSFVNTSEFGTDYGLLMSGAALAAIPMIIFFFAFQKYFMQGLRIGAVKG